MHHVGMGMRTAGITGMAAVLAVAIAACSSAPAQPPTPQVVAQNLHATGFTDCGPAPIGGVTDSGTAYLNAERIGIDTFPGADVRDNWEKASRDFGIVPFAQGDTWVAYKAVDQKARGCG